MNRLPTYEQASRLAEQVTTISSFLPTTSKFSYSCTMYELQSHHCVLLLLLFLLLSQLAVAVAVAGPGIQG